MISRVRFLFTLLLAFLAGMLFTYSNILMRSTVHVRDGVVWQTDSFRNETDFSETEAVEWILRRDTTHFNQHSFNDSRLHGDDTIVADRLFEQIRILCLVMTYPANHEKKAIHVNATWGKRCNKLLFVTRTEYKNLPTLILNVTDGRNFLGIKTRDAFDHAYKHYLTDYNWFLKADDDTYVIMENLRYFLSAQDYTSPVFFGQTFLKFAKQGYTSGGAGYIASQETVRRFGERSKRAHHLCAFKSGVEDIEFGKCMESLGVRLGSSLDALGRTRFHCFHAKAQIEGKLPDWYYEYAKQNASKKGFAGLSDYAISFHYINSGDMYLMEYFVYHLNPYGIIKGLQNLNSNMTSS